MSEQKPLKKPVDWDDLFPGRFLKAGQLGDRKYTLTIAEVITERLPDERGGERVKGILVFRESELQLALNKTNGICLREILGRDLSKWPGRKITLYKGAVESGSQRGEPAVRVWGSPELTEDRSVEIVLPRKRPFSITLHAVKRAERAADERPAP